MKKSIIALAVVASMGAQAHETTLYGSVRMAYTYGDAKDVSESMLGNSGSRFGIKGEDDLGNGMTAFYKYENRIEGNLNTNKLYVGLKGGFGSFSLGKQLLPLDNLTNYSDPFNKYTPGARNEKIALDSSDNSLVYWSPNMSGFQIGAAIVAKGAQGAYDDETVDAYQIVAQYEANGIYAGLGYTANQYLEGSSDKDSDAITLGLGYGNDMFEVGLVADRYDIDDSKANPMWVRLSGTYNITPSDAVYAGISKYDADEKGTEDKDQYSIGYQHKFSARTRVWTEYSYKDGGSKDSESNHFAVGLRTDF